RVQRHLRSAARAARPDARRAGPPGDLRLVLPQHPRAERARDPAPPRPRVAALPRPRAPYHAPVRVLLVSLYWPPAGGGGVQRPLKFATHLPALGIETHV